MLHHRHKHPRQRRIDRIGGIKQGVMAQVRVPLRRLDLCMPQQALHLVQAATRVDQEAGVRMPEVVDADISQVGFGSGRIPSAKDGHIGLAKGHSRRRRASSR